MFQYARKTSLLFLLLVLASAARPALAQTYTTISPNELAKVLKESGYVPEVQAESGSASQRIRIRVEGVITIVHFYNCEAGSCRSFQYWAYWSTDRKADIETINTWNCDHRFGRAYLDKDRDAVLEMDVNLRGGVALDHIRESVDTWRSIATDFRRAIGQ
jgi:hypothetical protein